MAVTAEADKGTSATRERPVSKLLLAAAWLVPGLGHWLLGKRVRAGVFAALVVASFVTGVLLDGELAVPQHVGIDDHVHRPAPLRRHLPQHVDQLLRGADEVATGQVLLGDPEAVGGGGDELVGGLCHLVLVVVHVVAVALDHRDDVERKDRIFDAEINTVLLGILDRATVRELHMFPALPLPIAFGVGMGLDTRSKVHVHQWNFERSEYDEVLRLNELPGGEYA